MFSRLHGSSKSTDSADKSIDDMFSAFKSGNSAEDKALEDFLGGATGETQETTPAYNQSQQDLQRLQEQQKEQQKEYYLELAKMSDASARNYSNLASQASNAGNVEQAIAYSDMARESMWRAAYYRTLAK